MAHLTADRLWAIPRVGAPTTAGDLLVVPVTTFPSDPGPGTTRLWSVRTDGTEPIALTGAATSSSKPSLSPDGSKLAFLRKIDDRPQVHVMPTNGGEATAVTDLPLGVQGFRWFPQGDRLVVIADVYGDDPTPAGSARIRDDRAESTTSAHVSDAALYRYWDRWLTDDRWPHLFVVAADGAGEPTDITPMSKRWMRWDNTGDPTSDLAVAPDGSEVAACFEVSPHPHDEIRWSAVTIDLASLTETEVSPDATGHASAPRYTPDGRRLLWGETVDPRFYADRVRIMRRDRDTGETTELTEGWDRSPSEWIVDGDRLILTAEDDGSQPLWSLPIDGGEPTRLQGSGTLSSPAVLGDGRVVAVRSAIVSPPELVVIGSDEPITTFTRDAMEGIDLPRVDDLQFEGARGDTVQAWVVTPTGVERPAPLVHMIHGGPHGTFGDTWHWRWNALAFCGSTRVAVLVNFHGSTGFGQEFASCIRGAWGDMPTQDIGAASDRLVADGVADPARIAITGGSYGGYMVSWLVSQTDRYRCAVAHAAVTALPGMEASDVRVGRADAFGAEVWEDLDRVNLWSPAAHAAGYTTPTLVIHGDKDYRVPVTQGLEFYGVLKAKGIDARLVHYPDENHWILKMGNSVHWYGEVTRWLDHHIG